MGGDRWLYRLKCGQLPSSPLVRHADQCSSRVLAILCHLYQK